MKKKLGYRLLLVGSSCVREQVINSLVFFDSKDEAIEYGMKYLEDIPQLKGFAVLDIVVFKQGCVEIAEKVYSYVR